MFLRTGRDVVVSINLIQAESSIYLVGVKLLQAIKDVIYRLYSSFKFDKTKGTWKTLVETNSLPLNSALNFADIASRGCTGKVFTESKWWNGSLWLKDIQGNWPQSTFNVFLKVEGERRQKIFCNLASNEECVSKTNILGIIQKESCWDKVSLKD